MPQISNRLRAELAFRIRTVSPREWGSFASHWAAFNAIYGGEVDHKERARVMASVRRHLTDGEARRVLRRCRAAIDRIIDVPPGNMVLGRLDPNFRAASRRCIAIYRDRRESSRGRLAAVAGVLYQVRCNLTHGSKDPSVERDKMLVRESLAVLRVLLPVLETAAL
jgi:hypothetical protein